MNKHKIIFGSLVFGSLALLIYWRYFQPAFLSEMINTSNQISTDSGSVNPVIFIVLFIVFIVVFEYIHEKNKRLMKKKRDEFKSKNDAH